MKITRNQLSRLIKEELRLLEADRDGDGKLNPDELRGLAGDLEGKGPGLPPTYPPEQNHPQSIRGQKMAGMDPLYDEFDNDFMKLATAIVHLEYAGWGGIIDALIDQGQVEW
jgi:hypothetical protein